MDLINTVNLKLLQTFMVVAEYESFRAAAEKLNRSHSAISAQIRQLEGQLGVQLFERSTRRVKLTDEGLHLKESAQRAMYEVSLGMRRIKEAVDLRRGQISLACSSSIAAGYLPQILTDFVIEFPEVAVSVRELPTPLLLTALRQKEVDFAVGPVVSDADFDFETILVEPLYALVPQRLLAGSAKEIRLKDLAKFPILLAAPATTMRRIVDAVMKEQGITLSTRYQFMQSQTLIAMAGAGLGAAILPESSMMAVRKLNAQMLRIVEPTITREIAIIQRRNQSLSPTSQRLVDSIRQSITHRAGLPRRNRANGIPKKAAV